MLMVQGTTSDAGKSLLVTALCRFLHRRGVRVAPFKPQNMALNSAVTSDGGEIGRAQAVQAQACGLEPHTDMNPILLKPNSDIGSQVIVQGRPVANLDAQAYRQFKPQALAHALDACQRLRKRCDVLLIEGAGSPAEINLREGDLANMGFAERVDCPVILVGDIDRGGVFAQFVGTLEILTPAERDRVKGFVINKFRGDIALLRPGLDWLEARTGKPVFGVLPFLPDLYLAAEDSFFRDPARMVAADAKRRLRVLVPRLPRLSNHTDLDPLRLHPGVELLWGEGDQPPPAADLIILPGSKSTRADLAWLRAHGWEAAIARHLRYGGKVIGICGGFQMLGTTLEDPEGVEGPAGSDPGLGWLALTTRFRGAKTLTNVSGHLVPGGAAVTGYEIHMGQSEGPALERPAMVLDGRPHGAISADGQLLGSYLHGLFDHPAGCQALLAWAGLAVAPIIDLARRREMDFDRLALAVEQNLHWPAIVRLLGIDRLGGVVGSG